MERGNQRFFSSAIFEFLDQFLSSFLARRKFNEIFIMNPCLLISDKFRINNRIEGRIVLEWIGRIYENGPFSFHGNGTIRFATWC